MSLASGSQIFCRRAAFDEWRQFVRQHPALADGAPAATPSNGSPMAYLLDGFDEAAGDFESGTEGNRAADRSAQPRQSQSDGVGHDEEPTLGWRPASALRFPAGGLVLQRRLGRGRLLASLAGIAPSARRGSASSNSASMSPPALPQA